MKLKVVFANSKIAGVFEKEFGVCTINAKKAKNPSSSNHHHHENHLHHHPKQHVWSKLPLPFVKHLLRRLQIPDYIRFSSVCHPWHISKKRAQTLPSQQQLPWFLLPRHVNEPSLSFYNGRLWYKQSSERL
ncbi:hypothetical protein QJS10_CPB21g00431 [Acorus calamus]|uniref:F-box domain-containing protein n=1 Tax=Acorus calamus TaxID=4465 RepID=A0AAV9C5Q8_ACOCL|nr:hypothetical protein QJS10_CPB21g00431 [Acorus calamus]